MVNVSNKAVFLRVGLDNSSGGTLAPIFPDDSFKFIPIPEGYDTTEDHTFGNYPTPPKDDKTFAEYLEKDGVELKDEPIHFDPEFETCTYGERQACKRKKILDLESGDLLVFYAGLLKNREYPKIVLYIIGYFTVKEVHDLSEDLEENLKKYGAIYPKNAHFKRVNSSDNSGLILVVGDREKSRLLKKAIPISEKRNNHYYLAKHLKEQFGVEHDSIQRANSKARVDGKYFPAFREMLYRAT